MDDRRTPRSSSADPTSPRAGWHFSGRRGTPVHLREAAPATLPPEIRETVDAMIRERLASQPAAAASAASTEGTASAESAGPATAKRSRARATRPKARSKRRPTATPVAGKPTPSSNATTVPATPQSSSQVPVSAIPVPTERRSQRVRPDRVTLSTTIPAPALVHLPDPLQHVRPVLTTDSLTRSYASDEAPRAEPSGTVEDEADEFRRIEWEVAATTPVSAPDTDASIVPVRQPSVADVPVAEEPTAPEEPTVPGAPVVPDAPPVPVLAPALVVPPVEPLDTDPILPAPRRRTRRPRADMRAPIVPSNADDSSDAAPDFPAPPAPRSRVRAREARQRIAARQADLAALLDDLAGLGKT